LNAQSAVRFCATGKRGLGHLRRITNIARLLHERGHHLGLVTNAQIAGISRDEKDIFHCIDVTPRERFLDALNLMGHGPVVVDTARINGLAEVKAPLVLILREARESKLPQFQLQSGRRWDQVLIPNPESYWTLPAHAINAARIDYVGWIFRKHGLGSTQTGDDGHCSVTSQPKPLSLIIASGGGGHVNHAYRQLLSQIVKGLRERVGSRIHIVQAIGPRSGADARISGADSYRDFGSELHQAFAQADIVISTAGYNSVLELATTTTPVLLIAANTTYDDQQARADRWGSLLGHGHVDVRHSVDWLINCVTYYQPRDAVDLGLSGAHKAVDRLEAIMQ